MDGRVRVGVCNLTALLTRDRKMIRPIRSQVTTKAVALVDIKGVYVAHEMSHIVQALRFWGNIY